MDWIEQWLGFNPDGGDGTIEAAIVVALAVVGITIAGVVSKRVRAIAMSLIHRVTRRSKTVR
jgi:hypothetical protein